MPAILEIPEVRQRVSPLSVQEYHRLGEYNEHGRRTELIRGVLIEKVSQSPLHRIIASILYDRLSKQTPTGFSVWKEEPLTLRDSEPEPDLSITTGEKLVCSAAHPTTAELVIEVAVSSPVLDRENAALYAEAGVKEYWIVLGAERQIEVYRRPQQGRYHEKHLFGPDEVLECAAVPGVRLRASELFE